MNCSDCPLTEKRKNDIGDDYLYCTCNKCGVLDGVVCPIDLGAVSAKREWESYMKRLAERDAMIGEKVSAGFGGKKYVTIVLDEAQALRETQVIDEVYCLEIDELEDWPTNKKTGRRKMWTDKDNAFIHALTSMDEVEKVLNHPMQKWFLQNSKVIKYRRVEE